MPSPAFRWSFFALTAFVFLLPNAGLAGGPRQVAGTTFFNTGLAGTPIHWANGRVNYYVDQGSLSASVSNQQAVAMVDAAAAMWKAVPTAGVALVDKGSLNEDVSGANAVAGTGDLLAPADVASTATSYPLGVIFDADGSVIDTVLGADSSDPSNCETTGVVVWTDNILADATVAHAVMVLNGRCTATAQQQEMMSFLIERAFGQILGLGSSQIYPYAEQDNNTLELSAWPIMQPAAGVCGFSGGKCIFSPTTLQYDDIASLNRLYPVTAANLADFPGKVLTAAHTVSIQGTISFRAGTGMQGVNVVAVPIDGSGNPMPQYAASFVSGSLFSGDHGNAVTGWNGSNGTPLSQWGSEAPALQGFFDLRFIPLPPGVTAASYQVTFESVDPLFILQMAVGPYSYGSPAPSGTLNPITVPSLSAGGTQTLAVKVQDSATGGYQDAIASASEPRMLPASGLWGGRISQVAQTDWFNFPVRANRVFTVVTIAVDEQGQPSNAKAMPALGIWDAFDPVTAPSLGTAPGLNGSATGESWVQVTTEADDIVRLGVADMRGDGRPDYAYNGWVLYADTVEPTHLRLAGGPIVIHGMGFHPSDIVLVNGLPAQVTSISPNEITAIAPPAGTGVSGSVDVVVDDLPIYYAMAILEGGISYDAGTGDSLTLVSAPANTVPAGVPIPFSVTVLGANLQPAGAVTVTYAVSSGKATLGCGSSSCSVTALGDGLASMNVTAVNGSAAVVTASLTNGASLQAHFSGGTPPGISALTPSLSLAVGASVNWTAEAIVLKNGAPASGQTVTWKAGAGIGVSPAPATLSSSVGIDSQTLSVGPLTEGQQAMATACLNGTTQCATFSALAARAEYATLQTVSGTGQSVSISGTPAPIILLVHDVDGNEMAGGKVTLYQSLYAWAPPCPPHGRCAQTELIGYQTATAVSSLDGTVSFTPAAIPGVATNTVGIAATGNTSTLAVAIEQHP
ncbi:MAG: IPT/TIG domain-containing protein [Terracidiphilus sp.]